MLAECVYALESFYELERERVAVLMRSALGLQSVSVVDRPLLLRALEVYELEGRERAQRLLADRTRFVLSAEQWAAFNAELDRPARARPEVVELLRRPRPE